MASLSRDRTVDYTVPSGFCSDERGRRSDKKPSISGAKSPASSSAMPSVPRPRRLLSIPGRAASASISARDLGGVSGPHSISIGLRMRPAAARKAARSSNGSRAPVTKQADAKRAPGRRVTCMRSARRLSVKNAGSANTQGEAGGEACRNGGARVPAQIRAAGSLLQVSGLCGCWTEEPLKAAGLTAAPTPRRFGGSAAGLMIDGGLPGRRARCW